MPSGLSVAWRGCRRAAGGTQAQDEERKAGRESRRGGRVGQNRLTRAASSTREGPGAEEEREEGCFKGGEGAENGCRRRRQTEGRLVCWLAGLEREKKTKNVLIFPAQEEAGGAWPAGHVGVRSTWPGGRRRLARPRSGAGH